MAGRGIGVSTIAAFVLLGLSARAVEEPRELVVTDFTFPWAERAAPRTTFRARTDGERLRFVFEVDDADVIAAETWDGESTVDGEDRVELFIAGDAELSNYWCVEIDPKGRVHDYHARHYRRFDSAWNCPGLKTEAERTPMGYVVRGSIPLTTLSALTGRPIARGAELRVGLFRAEFRGTDPATRGRANDDWIGWIRPAVPSPDFHVPEAFGTIVLP